MRSFPPTICLCPRKGLMGEEEYQNISYPKAATRDYNVSLQDFPQIPVSENRSHGLFPKRDKAYPSTKQ